MIVNMTFSYKRLIEDFDAFVRTVLDGNIYDAVEITWTIEESLLPDGWHSVDEGL